MATACGLSIAPSHRERSKIWRKLRGSLCGLSAGRDYGRLKIPDPAWTPVRDHKGRYVWSRCDEKNSTHAADADASSALQRDDKLDRPPTTILKSKQSPSTRREEDDIARGFSRFSFASANSAETHSSDATITPGTISYTVNPEPHKLDPPPPLRGEELEAESPIDPMLDCDPFSTPRSRFSNFAPQVSRVGSPEPPNKLQNLSSAASLDRLYNAFPTPNQKKLRHCVQLRKATEEDFVAMGASVAQMKRRSRLFLRPTSEEYEGI